MLVDLMSGKAITEVPYGREYRDFTSQLSEDEIKAIRDRLNEMIDDDEIHTAGWMPGSDWTGTVFEPIYSKAARSSYEASARCFGLMVWETFMLHPERWVSRRFEKDGEEIGCRTYFRDRS
jgi:hypothetical protein